MKMILKIIFQALGLDTSNQGVNHELNDLKNLKFF